MTTDPPEWDDYWADLAEAIAETGADDAEYKGEADLTNYPDNFAEPS